MKCSYCGNHLEKEAQFCPECGTILGADIDDNYEDFDTQVLEQENNVFSAPLVSEPSEKETENVEKTAEIKEEKITKDEPAKQTNPVIEEVFATEALDEVLPAQEQTPKVEPKKEKKKGKKNKKNKKNQAIAIEKYEDAFEPQEAFSNSADIKEEEIPQEPQEVTDIYSFSDDENQESISEESISEENDKTQILSEPQDTYSVFQTLPEPEQQEEQEPISTTFEIDEEPAKKKKKPLVAFLIMILIAAVCAAFAMNYDTIISALPETETTEEIIDTDVAEEMTDVGEETTADEDEIEEDTTEEDTTQDETTTAASATTTTAAATTTTTAATTAATTTTTAAATTTTAAATTTTAAATTTTAAATTTTATTTTATASTTTDPYGIGDATVQTPSSTVSAYTVYVQSSGLMITSEPSSSGERIIYVEKGADLTVSGEQDGYLYVYSNRIGVYGWISESSVATTRPVEETTTTSSDTEQPDTVYDEYITMYVSPSIGLNLRTGPSTSNDVIKNIQQNYEVQVVGYNSDDPSWVYVIDTTFGVTGWVSLEYLSTSEVR